MFTYSKVRVFASLRAMLVLSLLLFIAVSVWSIFSEDEGRAVGPSILIIGGALTVFWGPIAIFMALGYGGLSIDEDGVTTYFLGRRFRHFPWPIVTRIEKIKFLDQTLGQNRVCFWVFSEGGAIEFSDYLKRYATAVETLNSYIEKNKIPAFEFDHSVKSGLGRVIGSMGPGPSRSMSRPGEVGVPVTRFSS